MAKKIAIITGIAGQDAAYLAEFLLQKDYIVVGVAQAGDREDFWRLDYLKIFNRLQIAIGDIADRGFMEKLIVNVRVDEFYNLAGQSSVARSWEDPVSTFKSNAVGVVNILELIRSVSPATKFFQASSAEMYGDAKAIINEKSAQFFPKNTYASAKLAAHFTVKNFREQYGIFACAGVLFTHVSPLQPDFTVMKKIVSTVARIARGLEKTLTLGNLASRRDFTFAGDVVRIMWLMLQHKIPGDYVVCAGKSFSVADIAKASFAEVGIKNWKNYIEIDRALVRSRDVKEMRGSNVKARRVLNWKPEMGLRELLKKMVDFELSRIKA